MSEDRLDLRAALVRHHVRPWRWAFVVVAVVLTILTHWPRLELAPQVPASDKTIHLFAFASITVLLWRTRWVRSLIELAIICLLWAGVDELTQGLPGVNRWVSGYDAAANALGVIAAVAWIHALAPVGGWRNRQRLALQRFALDQVFAEPRTWLMLAIVFVICAGSIALAWLRFEASVMKLLIAIAALLCFHMSSVLLGIFWQQATRVAATRRPCFACGTSTPRDLFGETSVAVCPACGERLARGQWHVPFGSGLRTLLTLRLFLPIFLCVGTIVAFQIAIATTPALVWLTRRVPPTFTLTVDLAITLLIVAVATRVFRIRLGAEHDRAAIECRRCGHDVTRTPTHAGEGRCGECGELFYADEAQA